MRKATTIIASPPKAEPFGVGSQECTAKLLPLRDALDILGGKWKIMILLALSLGGKRRFTELQRKIAGIHQTLVHTA